MSTDLLEKLKISKAIMDKHDSMGRVNRGATPQLDNFDVPQAVYNIPQNISESNINITKPMGSPSVDAIQNSRLPDSIKKLMLEHPINTPEPNTSVLSDELIEKASKLMGTNKQKPPQVAEQKNIEYGNIQPIIEQTIKKVLKENGLLIESVEKSDELFSFRVGNHVFEGKITKIKKLKG